MTLAEIDFMAQVTEYATLTGWSWLHVRAGRTRDSWRVPVSGPLGKGFPDLLLVRGERLLAVELKRDGGKPTPEQSEVLRLLSQAGVTAMVWRPADWERIEATLR